MIGHPQSLAWKPSWLVWVRSYIALGPEPEDTYQFTAESDEAAMRSLGADLYGTAHCYTVHRLTQVGEIQDGNIVTELPGL